MRYLGTQYIVCAVSALFLAACGGSSDDGSTSSGSGTLSFEATDAPVDNVSRVQVTFDRLALVPEGEEENEDSHESFDVDPAITVDLLDLRDGKTEVLLDDIDVPAGEYEQIRLFLIDDWDERGGACEQSNPTSCVQDDEGDHGLFVPGNQPQSNSPKRKPLKLVSGFTVTAGGSTDFVIDFELRKALTDPQNDDWFFLRPAIRLIDKAETGTIEGRVSDTLVMQDKCTDSTGESGSAVYLYETANATPGDVFVNKNNGESQRAEDAEEADPVATADVRFDDDAGEFRYTLAFVQAKESDYTVAFSCQAGDDDPNADDAIDFDEQHNVPVNEGETTMQDFGTAG